MIFVTDANIIFSAIPKPKSLIAAIILDFGSNLILIAPEFLKQEVKKNSVKLKKDSGLNEETLDEVIELIFSRIHFYPDEAVPDYIQNHADQIVADIDAKDSVYVGFALYFNTKIWTGDQKLYRALQAKGFDLILHTTNLIPFLSSNFRNYS